MSGDYDFARNGWKKFARGWIKDYGEFGVLIDSDDYLWQDGGGAPDWASDAYNANDPAALDHAWAAELAKRPVLDPKGWTHLKKVGEHKEGYRYHIMSGYWCANDVNDNLVGCLHNTKDQAIAACEAHAKAQRDEK